VSASDCQRYIAEQTGSRDLRRQLQPAAGWREEGSVRNVMSGALPWHDAGRLKTTSRYPSCTTSQAG